MTPLEIERRCREALDNPLPQHPSPAQFRDVMLRHIVQFRNLIRNSGPVRAVESFPLTLMPGVEDYEITEANYGSFIYAHRVDPSNFDEPPVELVQLQNFAQYDDTPLQNGKFFVPKIAYFEQGGSKFFKIRPRTVNEVINLKVYFEPANPNVAPGDAITFPQHHHYLIARIVADVLPLCRWWPMDIEKANDDASYMENWAKMHMMRRKELAAPHASFAAEAGELLQRDAHRLQKPHAVGVNSGFGYESPGYYY